MTGSAPESASRGARDEAGGGTEDGLAKVLRIAPDPGLFGPGSVTWKVHADPLLGLGGLRALLLQAAHPLAMAGVSEHSEFRADPWGRLVTANQTVENLFRMRGESGWVDDGNGLVYNLKAFVYPELRITMPAAADPSPPQPSLLPSFSGAGACFLEGVAKCAFAGGQR